MKKSGRKLMSPQIDFCFKELMSVEFIRRGFILAVLGLEEEEVAGSRLMPTEIGGDRQEEKLIIMDVFVSLRDGTNINMEIQVIEIREWKNRSVFYLCKNIARQLRKGQGYEMINKCIQIGILNFGLSPRKKEYFTRYVLKEEKGSEMYTDRIELYTLELPKIDVKSCEQSEIWQWGVFFRGNEEEIEMVAERNKYIKRAYEELQKISADEAMWRGYEAREKALRDYNTQVNAYRREGMEEGQIRAYIDAILDFLSETGKIPDNLRAVIEEEKNIQLLKSWTRQAARVGSVEEFVEKTRMACAK